MLWEKVVLLNIKLSVELPSLIKISISKKRFKKEKLTTLKIKKINKNFHYFHNKKKL